MSSTISFKCPKEKALILQDIVKSTNGRFVQFTSDVYGDNIYVSIEHTDAHDYNEFHIAWERCNTLIKETTSSLWKKLFRKLKFWK